MGPSHPRVKSGSDFNQYAAGKWGRFQPALTLAANPALLIADEPTTALDTTVQAQILAQLAALQVRRGLVAKLFVSHDLAVVEGVAQRLAVMQHGTSLEARLTAQVFAAPFRGPYATPTVTADARV